MVFHMALMVTLALVLGSIHVASTIGQAPELVAQQEDAALPEITHFEVGYTPPAPSELTTETLMLAVAPSVEEQFNDKSPIFEEAGGRPGTTASPRSAAWGASTSPAADWDQWSKDPGGRRWRARGFGKENR